ncbi:RNA cytidine acetyltransferase-like [Stylophora pistillata]|uniref:RNA cytidine acetyltransferase-like n=1 Tax=Stylophora pistillata TaxID=50429 RepID=UPI000C04E1B9|nr:RNA cytidine acetyltransferase-like [Stylophora pistillata]
MVLKKVDNRIRVLIENGVQKKQRSLFVIVGDKGRDQVVILHHMLSKTAVKARPTVLWCYKKELGFSSHRKKRMKQLQKKIKSGTLDLKKDDPFELFVSATNIRYCYYAETHKILGNTYGMCVLQDFEALTPNLLARTVETVEGGGLIVLLLRTMSSLQQLYTLAMDVHSRYRTESHQDVVGRFNERFILSLTSNKNCMVIDDQLNILPISSHTLSITALPPKSKEESMNANEIELKSLKESLQDTQPVGGIVNCCHTLDQAKAVLKFIEAISEKTLRSTVTLTAARGRGKSAALGLSLASAVAFGYSNMFVTSPSPENLHTLFEFVFKGFDALEFQEHLDYELVQSTNPEFNKAVVRVNIFRDHRQTIQYIHPSDAHKLGQAELVVIDEAAAIPLPLVKELMGPYLVFLSSTVNGYEGTGRSLSLKLIQQLREQSTTRGPSNKGNSSTPLGRSLHEITLNESIRYAPGDEVERWLNHLLCLDATVVQRLSSGCPLPENCDLYYVNRDTLFSYHKASEVFLQRLMALYVASHYKNTPNDLQLLSDAPAHHIFCLLGPVDPAQNTLPEVYCVLQVCLEGDISRSSIMSSLSRGKRASGDLIPWTISQQFNDHDFAGLSGGRIVRIASHPDFQGMGYGRRAMNLLIQYYEGKIPSLAEEGNDEGQISTLTGDEINNFFSRLCFFYISARFWKKSDFGPVYLRQTPNDLTGEHSCIMLRRLSDQEGNSDDNWLQAYMADFRRRFLSLLSYQFRNFRPSLALSILNNKSFKGVKDSGLTKSELEAVLTTYDIKRLDLYSRNMVDYHLITDLLPAVSRLYFLQKMDFDLSAVQSAILLGLGLQHKTIEALEKELELPSSQLLGLFNRTLRKVVQCFNSVLESSFDAQVTKGREVAMEPLAQGLQEDLEEAAKELKEKQKKELEKLKNIDLSEFAISGKDDEWSTALGNNKNNTSVISVASTKRKTQPSNDQSKSPKKRKKSKQKHHTG